MLSKLFRYEMKSIGRLLLPMYGAVLLLSIINRLTLLFLSSNNLFAIVQTMLMMMYVLLVIASFFLSFVLMIQRFYKNLLGQEGYLMFTLPVTTTSHILSKALSSFIWIIATIVTVLVSIVITIPDSSWIGQIPQLWDNFSAQAMSQGINANIILAFLIGIILASILSFMMQTYTAMALGQLSNSHKLLCSFGAYIAIYFALQILISVALVTALACMGDLHIMFTENATVLIPPANLIYSVLGIAFGFNVVVSISAFFGTRYLLRNKLNLE